MTRKIQFGDGPDDRDELEMRQTAGEENASDAKLVQALTDFRASVHAWSEAVYTRRRAVETTARRRSWRLAAGWALGCVLVAGGVTGGVIEHQRQEEATRMAQAAPQQAQEQQQAAATNLAQQQDPGLLAKVDDDTSQEVPDAMEPLARLMEEGGAQ